MPGPLGYGVRADVVGKSDNHECLSADVGCHPLVEGLDFIETLVADEIGPGYGFVQSTYGLQPDQKCKDIARACFLPYDPEAYINPKYVPPYAER